MPLYEYCCKACDIRFERFLPQSHKKPRCPECGGVTNRIYRPSTFRLKGSGFHATDYGKHGPRSSGKR